MRDVSALREEQRAHVFEVMLGLPAALGEPHRHAGIGLRKVHPSGIWEARVGLGLRLVLAVEPGLATLVRAGSHEEIRCFLRSNRSRIPTPGSSGGRERERARRPGPQRT
ncbi:MAG: hypothetical protein HY744_32550, partial [Deltaproteobacteria bacterium]|nr:hypothetical protein [Deltaproteobacteria bacterium]